jgi:hypothetical protein
VFSTSNCCACNRCKMTTMNWKVQEVDIYSCSRISTDLVHHSGVVGSSDDVFLAAEQLNNTWF